MRRGLCQKQNPLENSVTFEPIFLDTHVLFTHPFYRLRPYARHLVSHGTNLPGIRERK